MKLTRPRWAPRFRTRRYGNRLLGVQFFASRRGLSATLSVLGTSWSTRGTYSVNGPSVLDFRGRWKEPATRERRRGSRVNPRVDNVDDNAVIRGRAPRRHRNAPSDACGLRWRGGAPCVKPAGHEAAGEDWHQPHPNTGQAPWKFIADTRLPWWRR